jgi:hypothetical protein
MLRKLFVRVPAYSQYAPAGGNLPAMRVLRDFLFSAISKRLNITGFAAMKRRNKSIVKKQEKTKYKRVLFRYHRSLSGTAGIKTRGKLGLLKKIIITQSFTRQAIHQV